MSITEIQQNEQYYDFEDKETGIKYSLPFEGRGTVSLYVLRSLPDRVRRQVIASLPSNSNDVKKPLKVKRKKGKRIVRLKNGRELPFAASRTFKKKPQQKLLNKSIPNYHASRITNTTQLAVPIENESSLPIARVTPNITTTNAFFINNEQKPRENYSSS